MASVYNCVYCGGYMDGIEDSVLRMSRSEALGVYGVIGRRILLLLIEIPNCCHNRIQSISVLLTRHVRYPLQ